MSSFANSRVGMLNRVFSVTIITTPAAQDALTPLALLSTALTSFTPLSATSSSFVSDAPSQEIPSPTSSSFVSDAPSQPSSPSTLINPYTTPLSPLALILYSAIPYAGTDASSLLANSGVSTWTDFPLSTSPRGDARAINRQLDRINDYTSAPRTRWRGLGYVVSNERWVEQDVVDVRVGFQAWSWTASQQPRTRTAALSDGGPLSPLSFW